MAFSFALLALPARLSAVRAVPRLAGRTSSNRAAVLPSFVRKRAPAPVRFFSVSSSGAPSPAAEDPLPRENIRLNEPPVQHPNQKQRRGIKPRDILEVEIESLAFGGAGIARFEGFVILVEGGPVPGDRCRVYVFKKKRGFAEARIEEVLRPGPARIAAPCPHFAEGCGGCKLQTLAYDEQVRQKHKQVKDLYERSGGYKTEGILRDTIGCVPDNVFGYRNKMEFTVSRRRWQPRISLPEEEDAPEPPPSSSRTQDYVVGLHVKGRFDKILPIHSCMLQDDLANEVLQFGTAVSQELNLEPYDIVEHTGFFRNFVIRTGTGADGRRQMMVNLVTATERRDLLAPLVERLLERFGDRITTIVNNITASLSGVAQGEREVVLHGPGIIEDTLRGVTFAISANSFFQPNSRQADVLYGEIEKACGLTGQEILWDLYCGTGSIGLTLAHATKHTYGFELVESAVENARANAARNGILNADFFQGDLSKLFSANPDPEILAVPHPDILVTDPPRAGMVPKLIDHIVRLSPKRIVYVSCNPSTQVRDIQALCSQGGYVLKQVLPVDQFPMTGHVECIAVLEK